MYVPYDSRHCRPPYPPPKPPAPPCPHPHGKIDLPGWVIPTALGAIALYLLNENC